MFGWLTSGMKIDKAVMIAKLELYLDPYSPFESITSQGAMELRNYAKRMIKQHNPNEAELAMMLSSPIASRILIDIQKEEIENKVRNWISNGIVRKDFGEQFIKDMKETAE